MRSGLWSAPAKDSTRLDGRFPPLGTGASRLPQRGAVHFDPSGTFTGTNMGCIFSTNRKVSGFRRSYRIQDKGRKYPSRENSFHARRRARPRSLTALRSPPPLFAKMRRSPATSTRPLTPRPKRRAPLPPRLSRTTGRWTSPRPSSSTRRPRPRRPQRTP